MSSQLDRQAHTSREVRLVNAASLGAAFVSSVTILTTLPATELQTQALQAFSVAMPLLAVGIWRDTVIAPELQRLIHPIFARIDLLGSLAAYVGILMMFYSHSNELGTLFLSMSGAAMVLGGIANSFARRQYEKNQIGKSDAD